MNTNFILTPYGLYNLMLSVAVPSLKGIFNLSFILIVGGHHWFPLFVRFGYGLLWTSISGVLSSFMVLHLLHNLILNSLMLVFKGNSYLPDMESPK